VFFDQPLPETIRVALDRLVALDPQPDVLVAHAARFDHDRFIDRLRQVVDEEVSRAR
jgi:hypothetical protein